MSGRVPSRGERQMFVHEQAAGIWLRAGVVLALAALIVFPMAFKL